MNALIPTPVDSQFYLRLIRYRYTENSIISKIFLSPIDKTGGKKDSKVFAGLELAWRGNKRSVSCIPPDIYRIGYKQSGRFYGIYNDRWGHDFVAKILAVKERSEILFHTGNNPSHSRGCVLIGTELPKKTEDTIPSSWNAYREFYKLLAKHRPQYVVIEQPAKYSLRKPKK